VRAIIPKTSAGRSPAIVDRFGPMVNVAMERSRFGAEAPSSASEEKANDPRRTSGSER